MKTKIILLLVVVIIVAVAGWFLLRGGQQPNENEPGTQNTVLPNESSPKTQNNTQEEFFKKPTEQFITFETSKGEVRVKNFYTDAVFVDSGGDAQIIRTEGYSIYYLAAEKKFYIDIASTDITNTQKSAENEVLGALGISRADACKLGIFAFIDKEYNTQGVGRYPLSFCPSLPD